MFGIQEELDVNGNGQIVLRVKGTKVATFPHPDNGAVQFAGHVSPRGKDIYVKTDGDDNASGNSWQEAVKTVTKTVALATDGAGDRIFVGEGAYDENVVVNKSKLTIIGMGGRGAAFIEPTGAGVAGMLVTESDVTLINLGVAGDDTADYALAIQGNGTGKKGKRFRAYGCKFEKATGGTGVDAAVYLYGDANYNVSDALFYDCEFAWSKNGILFDDSGYGYPTQIFIEKCRFHNNSTVHIGLATGGGVTNLHVIDSVFDVDEAGAEPTDFVKVDRAGDSGIFSGNRFSTATNAAAVLTIAADIHWVANATEAGWSTARPV